VRKDFFFTPADTEGCDCIVIAAANWLDSHSDFSDLAARLETTTLPVVIVGLGAQAGLDRAIPSLKQGTDRLVRLVAERSAAISVRGRFSAEVLEHYGLKRVQVTGCPSLLLAGATRPEVRRPARLEPRDCLVHGTRHLFHQTSDLQRHLYVEAFRQKLDLLLQSELADFYCALGRTQNVTIMERCHATLGLAYATNDLEGLCRYIAEHGKVFFRFDEWHRFVARKGFCVGTRIHGTVAALLAGTPATLIAHDARTVELAQTMNIPHVEASAVPLDAPFDAPSYHDPEAITRFQDGYAAYRAEFVDFFARNGLRLNDAPRLQEAPAQALAPLAC
jgi:polysaccharide pyruvyl transferase WcaK-like protein